MQPDWIEHRRDGDGELLGWMRPEGEGFVVIDLLGRERSGALDWMDAEEALERQGIGYLADAYELRLDEAVDAAGRVSAPGWLRVRIVEASSRGIRVKVDDFGAVIPGVTPTFFDLPFPPGARLRPAAPWR